MPDPRPLWKHQNEAIDYLRRSVQGPLRWGAVVIPTAGGKTRILQGAIHCLLRDLPGAMGVLVGTPMIHIEGAFTEDTTFVYAPHGGAQRTIDWAAKDWNRIRVGASATANLRAFLSVTPGITSGKGVAITTHAQLARFPLDDLPPHLAGMVLVIDEGHHNGEEETCLHDLAMAWWRRGGAVITATATPNRTDRRRIGIDAVVSYTRSYMAVAAIARLPQRITLRTLQLDGVRTDGRLVDSDFAHIATYIADTGRPTVLRIQPGAASATAAKFIDALVLAGIPRTAILNAVGEDEGPAVCAALTAERRTCATGTYTDLTYRVLIACRRLGEGADWPPCSHVVSVGESDVLLPVVQLLGRGARRKWDIAGYPEAWCDEILFTAFVPEWPVDSPAETAQVQRMMLLACALDCHEVVYDYMRFWSDLVVNFRLPPTKRTFRPALERLGETDIETDADAKLVGLSAAAVLEDIYGRPAKLSEVVGLVRRWRGRAGTRVLFALLARLGTTNPEVHADVHEQMRAMLDDIGARLHAEEVREDDLPQVYEDLLSARFAALAEKYADLACPIDVQIARGLTGTLTPTRVRRIVRGMVADRDAIFDFRDVDIVRKIIEPFKTKYGRGPTVASGEQDVSPFVGFCCDLTDVDRSLRRRDFDLSRLCACADVLRLPEVPVDVPAQRKRLGDVRRLPALDEHLWATAASIMRHREDPRYNRTLPGRRIRDDLVALELCARRGWRGLPGGQTLREVLSPS